MKAALAKDNNTFALSQQFSELNHVYNILIVINGAQWTAVYFSLHNVTE